VAAALFRRSELIHNAGMSEATGRMQPLAFLDATRGLAILLVVLVHVGQRFPGTGPVHLLSNMGQLGVQLFFVASGYTMSLSNERRGGESAPVLSFYLRRFFRIAPLYYVGILFFAGLQLARFHEPGPFTAGNVLSNAAFIHGFIPAANNTIVPGGWSIGAEMAFYAAFPLLTAAARGKASCLLAMFGAAVGINLLVQLQWGALENNSFRYFNLLNQLPAFLAGMFVYAAPRTLPALPAFALSASLLAVCAYMWEAGGLAFACMPALSGTAFAFLLVWLRSLTAPSRLLTALGKASFSIYIFHFALIAPVALAVRPLPAPPDVQLLTGFLVVTSAAYVVARLSLKWIETPGIQLGQGLVDRLQSRRVDPLRRFSQCTRLAGCRTPPRTTQEQAAGVARRAHLKK
jgi:peptidoglycan/LPS O-acetylase OafA/YrhL